VTGILNRFGACLEIQRDPEGGTYRTRRLLKAGDTISPLAHPETSILVAELFP
jgi:hypothetical protein